MSAIAIPVDLSDALRIDLSDEMQTIDLTEMQGERFRLYEFVKTKVENMQMMNTVMLLYGFISLACGITILEGFHICDLDLLMYGTFMEMPFIIYRIFKRYQQYETNIIIKWMNFNHVITVEMFHKVYIGVLIIFNYSTDECDNVWAVLLGSVNISSLLWCLIYIHSNYITRL